MFGSDDSEFSLNGKLGRLLLTLYTNSRPSKRWLGKEYAKNRQGHDDHDERNEVWMPCVSMVGMTVPSSFYKLITPEMIDGGAMNRILVFQSENPNVTSNRAQTTRVVPSWVVDRLRQLDRLPVHGIGFPETPARPMPALIRYTQQANRVFSEMREESDEIRLNPDIPFRQLDLRMEQQAKKIALVTSLFNGEEEVSGDAAKQARETVVECVRVMKLQLIHRAGDHTQHAKNVRRVLTLIQSSKASGISAGFMSRKLRGIKASEREEILAELVAEGQIEVVRYAPEGKNAADFWRLRKNSEESVCILSLLVQNVAGNAAMKNGWFLKNGSFAL